MERLVAYRRRMMAHRLERVDQLVAQELDTFLSRIDLPAREISELQEVRARIIGVAQRLRKSALRGRKKIRASG